MIFRKKVARPENIPHHDAHIRKPASLNIPKELHPEFRPVQEYPVGDLEDYTNKNAPDSAKLLSIYNSPIAGSCATYVDHDPEDIDNNTFGFMIDIDNPAFQQACRDLTIYDRDMNVIGTQDNVGAIGVTFKEDYARPIVDMMESTTAALRVKYNQIYDLQKAIIDRK